MMTFILVDASIRKLNFLVCTVPFPSVYNFISTYNMVNNMQQPGIEINGLYVRAAK
jgi:hypothetical protein